MDAGVDLNTVLQIIQTIVVVLGFPIALFKFLSEMKQSLAVLTAQREAEAKINAEKFDKIELQLRALNETTIKIAAQEARLDAYDTRLNDIMERIECIKQERIKLLPPPRRKKAS